MKPPLYKALLEKSVSAIVSAIEVYNKPDFKYREETFSILAINSWELLLKAQLLKYYKSQNCLYIYEYKLCKNGQKRKIKSVKKNRCQTPMTISIGECILKLAQISTVKIDPVWEENLNMLIQIRDSSIHFHNTNKRLSITVYELGMANLKNYVTLIKQWFDYDLSRYNFYLMPLSFFHDFESIESFSVSLKDKQIRDLLKYISEQEQSILLPQNSDFSVSMKVQTQLFTVKSPNSLPVASYSSPNDPQAVTLNITEEEWKKKFPFDYSSLKEKLKVLYIDFKENQRFRDIMKDIKIMPKMVYHRPLNIMKPEGAKTTYYSTEVFKVFNQHYTKR